MKRRLFNALIALPKARAGCSISFACQNFTSKINKILKFGGAGLQYLYQVDRLSLKA